MGTRPNAAPHRQKHATGRYQAYRAHNSPPPPTHHILRPRVYARGCEEGSDGVGVASVSRPVEGCPAILQGERQRQKQRVGTL